MKSISLTNGHVTLVDDEDFEYLNQWKWRYHKGYAIRNIQDSLKTNISIHIQLLTHLGIYIPDMLIIHMDGDNLNNQRGNLKLATRQQTRVNSKLYKNNTSGFRGVNLHKGKWRAYLRLNGRFIYLGGYRDRVEAAIERDKAALEYFGEFARLNILEKE